MMLAGPVVGRRWRLLLLVAAAAALVLLFKWASGTAASDAAEGASDRSPLMLPSLAKTARERMLATLSEAHRPFVAPDGAGPPPPQPPAAAGATASGWARYVERAPTGYDDLAAPVRPLSADEAALVDGAVFVTAKTAWTREDDGLRAIATRTTFKSNPINRTGEDLAALERKYCGHCRQYVAGVPNRGARVGHYFSHWLAIFTYARRLNRTLLYHPIVPNQAEHQLFDRYFGFGYPEPFQMFEPCVQGVVGEACTAYLPCLTVSVVPSHQDSNAALSLTGPTPTQCDVVYEIPDNTYPENDRSDFAVYLPELRHRFHRARRLDPIPLLYSEEHLSIAIHIRRGDVASNPSLKARYTHDTTYVVLLRRLRTMIENHAKLSGVLRGRVRAHVFSQGDKANFLDLQPLEDEGWLQFHLDASVTSTLFHLTMADIMVCAKSGFSFMAASLREPWQPTLYTPTLSMNLPGWITYDDATGAMDEAQATAMVDVLLASLHRRALLVRSLRRS